MAAACRLPNASVDQMLEIRARFRQSRRSTRFRAPLVARSPLRLCTTKFTSPASSSLERDDAILPELIENQHRVGLADRTDLQQRPDIPLAVDPREDEAFV